MPRLLRCLRRPTRRELILLGVAAALTVLAFVIERSSALPQPYEFVAALIVRVAGIFLALHVGDQLVRRAEEEADAAPHGPVTA